MYVVIYSDGQVSLSDMHTDCRSKSWIPMAVLRGDDGSISVPCFLDMECAKRFASRNMPREWIKGAVLLADEDFESIKSKGWALERFEFPRLVRDRKGSRLDFEIYEFASRPELMFL